MLDDDPGSQFARTFSRLASAKVKELVREKDLRPLVLELQAAGASVREIQDKILKQHNTWFLKTEGSEFEFFIKEAVISVKLDEEGLLHTENDDPALVMVHVEDGDKQSIWQRHGRFFERANGEANSLSSYGSKWLETVDIQGEAVHRLHRVGGPAEIRNHPRTFEHWMIHGVEHRIGGPSYIKDGRTFGYKQNGIPTREGGLFTSESYNTEGELVLASRSQLKKGRSMNDPRPFNDYFWLEVQTGKVELSDEEYEELCEKVKHEDPLEVHSVNDLPAHYHIKTGSKWFEHGALHRDGKPAWIDANNNEHWFYHGLLHRADGPATIDEDGTPEHWILGERQE